MGALIEILLFLYWLGATIFLEGIVFCKDISCVQEDRMIDDLDSFQMK